MVAIDGFVNEGVEETDNVGFISSFDGVLESKGWIFILFLEFLELLLYFL
jgi:hypothetical protein